MQVGFSGRCPPCTFRGLGYTNLMGQPIDQASVCILELFTHNQPRKENKSQSQNKNYSVNRGYVPCHRIKTKAKSSPQSESVKEEGRHT